MKDATPRHVNSNGCKHPGNWMYFPDKTAAVLMLIVGILIIIQVRTQAEVQDLRKKVENCVRSNGDEKGEERNGEGSGVLPNQGQPIVIHRKPREASSDQDIPAHPRPKRASVRARKKQSKRDRGKKCKSQAGNKLDHFAGVDTLVSPLSKQDEILRMWDKMMWSTGDAEYDISSGRTTVQQAGVYFLFAQVLFSNKEPQNGYHVVKETATGIEIVLNCLHDVTGNGDILMTNMDNTCVSVTVLWLNPGERLYIQSAYTGRALNASSSNTHWGLVYLSGPKKQGRKKSKRLIKGPVTR